MARLKVNKNPTDDEVRRKFQKAKPDYLLKSIGDVQQDGTILCMATDKKTGKWKNFWVKIIL